MADEIRAQPRNSLAALLSDAINSGVGYMKSPQRTQQLQGLGRLIESTQIPYVAENLSYDPSGRNLFTGGGGLGGTTRMRPEAIEAAMNVAPFVAPVNRALMQATKGLPVGASIQDVGGLFGKRTPSPFVQNVEAGKELIVHHNISPEKLARVEKVGGMPVPSIAVSNVENPLSSFGNISLIGDKSMAMPSAKNPVYGFDAYTSRTPEINYSFDKKSLSNIDNYFSDVAQKVPSGDYLVDRLKNDWKYRSDSDIYKAKFLDEQGKLPDPANFKEKPWEFQQEVNQLVRDERSAFEGWSANMDNALAEAGVTPTERIFKGFTDSGNRRYAPATLDNLVKDMKGGAGAEGFFYGVGNIRAVATPKFRNFEQVKAGRENIVSSKDFEPVKKQVNDAFENLTDRMRSLEGNNNYAYKPEDALYELGQVKNVNFLDKIYKDVPESLKADVQIFMNKVKQMPTEYFEIKPQRAVQVSEFSGAIAPKGTPQKSIDYLKSQGVDKIYFYETPQERTELFKKFGDKMFAVPALPIATMDYTDPFPDTTR